MGDGCRKIMRGLWLALAVMAGAAQATPAVQLTVPGTEFDGSGWTLGFEFQVTRAVQVSALGAYDSAQDGLAARATVGLWEDGPVPTLLAMVQVPSGAAASLDGFFRFVDTQAVLLLPDHLYVVAAFYEDDLASSLGTGNGGTGSFDARLSQVVDRSSDSGFELPIGSDGQRGAWLGGNLQLQDLRSVPEPATAGLAALALLAGGVGARRRR